METLKQRLDSLRKAKSTTIIKREREEVLIQPPNLGRRFSALDTSSNSLTASKQSLTSNSHSELEGKRTNIIYHNLMIHCMQGKSTCN